METAESKSEELDAPLEPLPDSNYQAPSHFISLSLLSFGVYTFFWHYKQWLYLKEEKKLNIHPGFKTLFALFTAYSLLRHFKKLAKESGYQSQAPYNLLFFIQSALIFINLGTTLSPLLIVLAWLSPLLMLPALNMMNAYYLKTQVNHHIQEKLGLDEWIFLAVVWGTILLSVF